MGRGWLLLLLLLGVHYLTFFELFCFCVGADAMESPQYIVVRSAVDVEIRLYRDSSWMSALVRGGTSFKKSTHDGFHRLYQYIHGANSNSTRIMITKPILTSFTQATHGSDYLVKLYLPERHELTPPQPYSELNLHLDKSKSHCIAVRKFSGFAEDENISKEKESLQASLSKLLNGKAAASDYKSSYTVAQYNASFHASGRLNEVWINVSGFTTDGCPSN